MKRSQNDGHQTMEHGAAPGPSQPPKRQKSTQACVSCRKHKTRCELLDGVDTGSLRCHRCKVLNLPCSFEMSDFPGPRASASRESLVPPTPRIYARNDEQDHTHTPGSSTLGESATFASESPSEPTSEVTMKLEDVVPKTTAPWGFLKEPGGHDWTMNPMLAMQELLRIPHPGERQIDHDDHIPLESVLSREQISYLLDIFEKRYSPWINIPRSQDVDHSMVLLARCIVASRHLDAGNRSIVTPQLQKLVDASVPKIIFDPLPSTASIQALLILSLWAPIGGGSQAVVRDGRLLIAAAVSLAMNLRLSNASVYAATLLEQARTSRPTPALSAELGDAIDKARLWLSVSNAESMLCQGTGRTPISYRSESDLTVLNSSIFGTTEARNDMRLSLTARLFQTAERASQVRLDSLSQIESWYKDIMAVLVEMDATLRLIAPLPVVQDYDLFYFHMLQVHYYGTRLLILHATLRQARDAILKEGSNKLSWAKQLGSLVGGVNLTALFGHDTIHCCEMIMILILSAPEPSLLGTAPDNIFGTLAHATALMISTKFATLQDNGSELNGSSDHLLRRTIERLRQIALSPEHAPAKCAQLISAFVATWEMRSSRAHMRTEDLGAGIDHAVSAERYSSARSSLTGLGTSSATMMSDFGPTLAFPLNDSNPMNSDIFLDTDFWASFMDNLTTDGQ